MNTEQNDNLHGEPSWLVAVTFLLFAALVAVEWILDKLKRTKKTR